MESSFINTLYEFFFTRKPRALLRKYHPLMLLLPNQPSATQTLTLSDMRLPNSLFSIHIFFCLGNTLASTGSLYLTSTPSTKFYYDTNIPVVTFLSTSVFDSSLFLQGLKDGSFFLDMIIPLNHQRYELLILYV